MVSACETRDVNITESAVLSATQSTTKEFFGVADMKPLSRHPMIRSSEM